MNCSAGCVLGLVSHTTVHIVRFPPNKGVMVCLGAPLKVSMQGTLPFTLFILTLSQSLPVYSHTIRLSACLFSPSRYLSILTRSGSLPVYSLTLAACLFSHSNFLRASSYWNLQYFIFMEWFISILSMALGKQTAFSG